MNTLIKKYIENNLHHVENGKIIDLFQERLSVDDYQWLSEIIKKSSSVETIVLPQNHKYFIGYIISILNSAIINNSTITTLDLDLSVFDGNIPVNISMLHQQIKSRLQRNSKKIFAIYGGGNIGLGLMADIISKSQTGYKIVATSNNRFLYDLVNSKNQLWLQHGSDINSETTCVNSISMVSRNCVDVVKLFSEACLASICVTPTVLHDVANDIAHALISRYEIDGSGLKILVLMNIPNCANFVREKIAAEMVSITKDECYSKKILSGIEFIQTVIDRIVTPINEETVKNQLKAQLVSGFFQEDFNKKNQSEEHILNYRIDEVINDPEMLKKSVTSLNLKFNLFNAEKNFSMYVEDNNFPEVYRLPFIKKAKDLNQIEAIKNKYINGPHAILAWAGALFGCATIAESIRIPFIFGFIKEMMEYEIGPILTAEYPDISKDTLMELESSFFARCLESTNDPVIRVGRDPLRKLDTGGRIRGTIELAQKHQLSISTHRLEHGIAAGLLYAVNGIDASNPGCQKILELLKSSNNSFMSVLCYNGIAPGGSFSGLHPYRDSRLIKSVLIKIDAFNQWRDSIHRHGRVRSPTTLDISKYNTWIKTVPLSKSVFTKIDNSRYRFLFAINKSRDEDSHDSDISYRELKSPNKSIILFQASNHILWKKPLSIGKLRNINVNDESISKKCANTLK